MRLGESASQRAGMSANEFGRVDLAPHAMIQRPVSAFSEAYGLEFNRDTDDLDGFSAIYLELGAKKAALIHYDGEPADCLTIFVQRSLSVKDADKVVAKILRHYLSEQAISWRETIHQPG